MDGYHKATRFISRILGGCIFAVVVGNIVDQYLHTTPLIMLIALLYVIFGSLYLLVRESGDHDGTKNKDGGHR